MALKVGQTNAIFLDAQGKQIGTLEVFVGSNVADLNDQLTRQLKGAKIKKTIFPLKGEKIEQIREAAKSGRKLRMDTKGLEEDG